MELPYLAFTLLIITGYLDILDGSVARAVGYPSSIGAVLDIVSDRIVEFSVIVGLFAVDPVSRGLICLLMSGSVLICITSFLVVGIFVPNTGEKSFHYSPGLMERSEAFLFFGLMMLFPSLFMWLGILFVVLVALTAVIRVKEFTTQLQESPVKK